MSLFFRKEKKYIGPSKYLFEKKMKQNEPAPQSLSKGSLSENLKRKDEYNYLDLKKLNNSSFSSSEGKESVRVLSYNLLADSFLYKNDGSTWYYYTNPKYLVSEYRYDLMVVI